MEFQVKNGTYLKDKNSTSQIMSNILISLIPFVILYCYQNGFKLFQENHQVLTLFKPPLIISLSIIIFLLTLYLLSGKGSKKDILKDCRNYQYPLILSLLLPFHTPLIITVLGVIIMATFKKILTKQKINYFNIIMLGYLSVTILSILYHFLITKISPSNEALAYLNSMTNLNLNYLKEKFSLSNFFLIFNLISFLLAFLYLKIKKAIKIPIPLSYLLTSFIMFLLISTIKGYGPWYSFYYLILSNSLSISLYLLSETTTSPITKYGMFLYGASLAILNIIFLLIFKNNFIILSVLIINIFNYLINKYSNLVKISKLEKILYTIIILFTIIAISFISYIL